MVGSYRRFTGRSLVPDSVGRSQTANWLLSAPFALLAHDTSPDPAFIYANRAAQKLFGYDVDEFVGLPSRLSAGVQDRGSRRLFIESVRKNGHVEGYRGRRVRKDGGHFWIEDVTVWNLVDGDDEVLVGQAALIRRWTEA